MILFGVDFNGGKNAAQLLKKYIDFENSKTSIPQRNCNHSVLESYKFCPECGLQVYTSKTSYLLTADEVIGNLIASWDLKYWKFESGILGIDVNTIYRDITIDKITSELAFKLNSVFFKDSFSKSSIHRIKKSDFKFYYVEEWQ